MILHMIGVGLLCTARYAWHFAHRRTHGRACLLARRCTHVVAATKRTSHVLATTGVPTHEAPRAPWCIQQHGSWCSRNPEMLHCSKRHRRAQFSRLNSRRYTRFYDIYPTEKSCFTKHNGQELPRCTKYIENLHQSRITNLHKARTYATPCMMNT